MASALTEITYEAWLEARPKLNGLRDVRAYASAILCGAILFAVVGLTVTYFPNINIPWWLTVIVLAAMFQMLATLSSKRAFLDWAELTLRGRAGTATHDMVRATSTGALKRMIAGYAARLPDWDGAGGIAPRPDAIADALTFIDRLPDRAPIPEKVYAPGDGEVMFQWIRPDTFIEVGFYGDDTISWFARVPGRNVSYGDDPFERKFDRRVPQPLAEALHSIA